MRITDDRWVAIDSMLAGGEAVALRYLRHRGVDPSHIEIILATHWHSDHILGLDQLVTAAPNARFMYPNVHSTTQLKQIAAAGEKYASSTRPAAGQAFAAVLRALGNRPAKPVGSSTVLIQHRSVRLLTLSPTDHAVAQGLTALGAHLDRLRAGRPVRIPKPNATSVAAFLVASTHCAVFGADLIDHPLYGWDRAVIETEGQRGSTRGRLLKIPHHGSKGADATSIWSDLMDHRSVGGVSPYSPSRLPSRADLRRVAGRGCIPHVASTTAGFGAAASHVAALGPDVEVDDSGTMALRFTPVAAGWDVHPELI